MTRAPAPEVGSAANSYEILAKLAMGGMAEIFLARGASSAGVERYVVLKRVLRHRADDAHFVRMFLDEARLAAQLQHPNIAQVYDIGKLGDSYFFTMEYVHGETVRTLLQRSHALRRTIPIGSVLSIVAGAAAGLHHAHDRKGYDGKPLGIVHRDVSPSNLMVSYEGTVKVVDFGVAKAEHRSTETQSGTVKGKITYMSPEQCKGGDIDRRSDLFSLGIVMWEMLTTERLFRKNSDFENMQAIVSEPVAAPSTVRAEIPPEIDAIVLKLLSKSPADRYQNGDELHEAIEAAAVRTGSALSAASLGRYMRELFGQRPEPWIELQTADSHPEAFTVTSEPLAPALGMSPEDALDRKLSGIPQLAPRVTNSQPNVAPPPVALPTVPVLVQADMAMTMQLPPSQPPARPSAPEIAEGGTLIGGPVPQSASGSVPQYPGYVAATPGSGVSQQMEMRPHTPSLTPGSNPQYPMLSSSSHAAYHRNSQMQTEGAPRRSRALLILGPAVLIGVVIGIILAFSGSKKADPPTTVATDEPSTPTESSTTNMMTTTTTTGSNAAIKVDTGSAGSAAVATTPTKPPTDTPPTGTPDTKTPTDTKTDAKAPVDGKTPKTDPHVVKTPKTDTHVVTKAADVPDVAELYKDRKYADVVSACSASKSVLNLNSTTCTIAACKQKDASKAKRWFGTVGAAKRTSVRAECGTLLPAESASPDARCKIDPMACQH